MKRVIVVTKIKHVLDQWDSLIYKCDTQALQSIWDNLESFHTKTLITDPLLRAFPFDRTIDMWTKNEKRVATRLRYLKKIVQRQNAKNVHFYLIYSVLPIMVVTMSWFPCLLLILNNWGFLRQLYLKSQMLI